MLKYEIWEFRMNIKCKACNRDNIPSELKNLTYCSKCDLMSTTQLVQKDAYEKGNYSSYQTSGMEHFIIKLNCQFARIFMLPFSKGKWLDFGCGKGHLLSSLPKNYIKFGWETNKIRASIARKNNPGVVVIEELYGQTTEIDSEVMDVISLFHVLEHLENPVLAVKLLDKHLASDGKAIIEVPNFNSCQAKIAKGNWLHLDIPNHQTHWSYKSLQKFFETHQYKIIKTSQISFTEGIFGMADSLFFCKSKLRIYDRLKGSFFKKLFMIPVLFLSAIIEFTSCFFKAGGINRILITRK